MAKHPTGAEGGGTARGPEPDAARLQRLNAVLRAIRNVNQLITKEDNRERLIQGACANLTDTLSYHNAWIALFDEQGQSVVATAHSGFGPDFSVLQSFLGAGQQTPCMREALARDAVNAVLDPPAVCHGCPVAMLYNGRAGLARRLEFHGRVFGLLVASVPVEYARDEEEQGLFNELAGDLAFALNKITLTADLHHALQRYRQLFDGSRDGFVLVSPEGRVVDANPAYCEMLGYTLEELRGLPDFYAVTPARWHTWEREEIWQRRLLKQGESGVYEKEYRHKDGTVFPVELRSYAVRNPDGNLSYLWGTVRDITERKAAEEALRRSEHRFRSFIENASDMVFAVSPEGRFTYVSPNWPEFMGEPAAAAIGRSFEHYVHPEDAAICRDMIARLRETGRRQPAIEYRVRDPGGGWRWHITTGSLLLDTKGQPVELVGIARDVTESKRAEEAVRASEERSRLLAEVTLEGIVIHRQGVAMDVNQSAANMLGYAREDLVGRDFMPFMQPEDHELIRQNMAREYAAPYTVRMLRRDGSQLFVEVESRNFDNKGERWRVSALRDVTRRMRDEEALRQSEEKFATAFRTAPYAIAITRARDGLIIDINEAFTTVTGYTRDEAVGQTTLAIALWARAEDRQAMIEAMRSGSPVRDQELQVRHKNGTPITGLFSAQLIQLGGESCVLSSLKDITQHRRDQEERRRLELQLAQAQKMESIGRLAGGVAHDFNNLLMVIQGSAELCLKELPTDHPARGDLEEIQAAGDRAGTLTQQLLTFARRQTIAPRQLDLNQAVSRTLQMLRRLLGEDIQLLWQPGLVDQVRLDPGQLDQVLANLCVNARDAIHGIGQIEITTSTRTIAPGEHFAFDVIPPGEYVELSVRDNGAGMEPEVLAHIFEPFYTTKELGQGTGLGLATVLGIVKQNGGYIDVQSTPGQGTHFRLFFPGAPANPAEAEQPSSPNPLPHGTETILFVEDELAVGLITKRILEDLGYHVLAASSPEKALELAEQHGDSITLLLTDVIMPGMTGRDLARRIHARWPSIRCLYVSGYTADIVAKRGVIKPGLAFLAKPFSREQLALKIREVLTDSGPTAVDTQPGG